jgi:nuclear transport factor 2 (NTF2) superfamily protein
VICSPQRVAQGNELWEFDAHGLMRRREASIDDLAVEEADRRIRGPRPAEERPAEQRPAGEGGTGLPRR